MSCDMWETEWVRGSKSRASSQKKKSEIRRGEIWTANFDSSGGEDIAGVQFVVIVSNNSANRHAKRIQVVPIGFHEGSAYPCEAVITIKRNRRQKAVADRIQTISKDQLIDYCQRVGHKDMEDLDRAVTLQLGLIHLWASSSVSSTPSARAEARVSTRTSATE